MDLRTGVPLWPWRAGLLATYPPLRRPERAEIVVIGAGITGALVAHALATASVDVVVVDRRDVAAGSSAATTGHLMYETDTELAELSEAVGEARAVRAWQLGLEVIDHIAAVVAGFDDSCGFSRRRSLYLASSSRDARRLETEAAMRSRLGFDAVWLDKATLGARFGVAADGAILSTGDAQVDCYRLTHRLLQAAAALGTRVYDRTQAVRIEENGSGLRLYTDGGQTIDCHRVVWAAGYEGVEETQRRVGRMRSTWVVATEPLEDEPWRDAPLLWESARPYVYARVTDDGRVLVGGEDEPFGRRHTSERLMNRKTARLVARMADIVPGLTIEPSYRWAGTFSETKDGLPYIGSVPEHPRAWLAMGYGGNGITFSAIAARIIRDEWLGRRSPDAAIFAFDR